MKSIDFILFLYSKEINLFETDTILYLKLIFTINFRIVTIYFTLQRDILKHYILTEVIFPFQTIL